MSRIHTITLHKADGTLVGGFYPGLDVREHEELCDLVEETVTTTEARRVIEEFASRLRRVVVLT